MGDKYLGSRAIFLCASVVLCLASYMSWRKKKAAAKKLRNLKRGNVNIGGIFGMDVGGTLTKIVYFETDLKNKHDSSTNKASCVNQKSSSSNNNNNNTSIKRTDSLSKLDQPDHQEALHKLYDSMKSINEEESSTTRDRVLSFYSHLLGGRLHFLHFETRNMMSTINLLSSSSITDHIRNIGCTGGGAVKYATTFQEELGITITPFDELASLVTGMHYALTNIPSECYTYRNQESGKADITSGHNSDGSSIKQTNRWTRDVKDRTLKVFLPLDYFTKSPPPSSPSSSGTAHKANSLQASSHNSDSSKSLDSSSSSSPAPHNYDTPGGYSAMLPYLVVNVGSGVSILKVTSPTQFERISGSSVGGGTYWGLCRYVDCVY